VHCPGSIVFIRPLLIHVHCRVFTQISSETDHAPIGPAHALLSMTHVFHLDEPPDLVRPMGTLASQ